MTKIAVIGSFRTHILKTELSFWKMVSLVTDDFLTKRAKNLHNDGRVIFQVDSVSSLLLITSFTVSSPSKAPLWSSEYPYPEPNVSKIAMCIINVHFT